MPKRFVFKYSVQVVLLCQLVGGAFVCAEKPVRVRIMDRDFPSVFQAWSRAENVDGKSGHAVTAMHDLVWHGVGWFGLRWESEYKGLGTSFGEDSISDGLSFRKRLLAMNPNMILIAEIRYRDASRSFLPSGHEWWLRDEKGKIVDGWEEGKYLRLDFGNSEYRRHVAGRAKAVVDSGVVDGILLDWWRDDDDRVALIKEIRKAISDDFLIIANANDIATPRSASYINGYFMECWRSKTTEDWERISESLLWAEKHLRAPQVNCVETWFHNSRGDLNLMRSVTTLSLTHSDGYSLFSDPNPLKSADHLHNFYSFWKCDLGRAKAKGFKKDDGTFVREFENGTVVYNPMGNYAVRVVFGERRKSVSGGEVGSAHDLSDADGDIYLKVGKGH